VVDNKEIDFDYKISGIHNRILEKIDELAARVSCGVDDLLLPFNEKEHIAMRDAADAEHARKHYKIMAQARARCIPRFPHRGRY
jgi:hypothetical protein